MAENGILDYQGMNQAIYRGATSNIVVDTQSMSIEIGAGNTSHTSNLHFECDHDANVASIKLNSNVTTEFSRSKKLIKYPRVAIANGSTMATGAGVQTPGLSGSQDGFVATSSSSWGGGGADSRGAWCAFDEGTSSTTYKIWQSGNYYTTATPGVYNRSPPQSHTANGVNYEGEWIKLELPHKINVSTIEINSAAYSTLTGHHTARPYEGAILASNDDTNWSLLKSFSDGLDWTATAVAQGGSRATLTPNTNTTNYYRYLMLVVNKIQGSRSSVDINEIRYYGIPEYDPEAHGTDVKVTSYPNVPNTDWLEVYYDAKDLADGSVTSVDDLTPSGTTDGTATSVTVSDGAFVFDGTSDIRSTVSTFTGDQPHTMSVWVNISTSHTLTDGYICVLAPSTGENVNQVSTIRYQNDGFNLQSWGNDIQMYNIGVEKGRWYHLVAVYDGGGVTTSSKRLYIDTVQNTRISGHTTSGVAINFANTTLSLGSRVDGTSSHLTGSIANFRLFNRALTTDEIYQLYAYQKEYFGHGDLSMTLKAGRLYVNGDIHANGGRVWPIPNAVFQRLTPSTTSTSSYYSNNIGTHYVTFDTIYLNDDSRTIQFSPSSTNITLSRTGVYEIITQSGLALQNASTATHAAIQINILSGGATTNSQYGYATFPTMGYGAVYNTSKTHKITVTSAPAIVGYRIQPRANNSGYLRETAYGPNNVLHSIDIKYLG